MQHEALHEHYYEELQDLARCNDIYVSKISGPSSEPDTATPSLRWININPNFDTNYSIPFRLAHELDHVINADHGNIQIYNFSPLGKRSEERRANRNAIIRLLNMYFPDGDFLPERYLEFMRVFGIGSYLEPIVLSEIVKR